MQNAIKSVRVMNMKSIRTGTPVANQFVIETPDGEYFQSYDSVIAFRDTEGKITLDQDYWDYSVTTGRYRNEFLAERIAETRMKIDSGDYKLAKLN